jgi:hypothetical protein
MHRVILGNSSPHTDHINGNGLDNRRSNIREATGKQNARNCARPVHNTSGVKGVSWHSQRRKWAASICVNKRAVHVGLFNSKEDAAKARDAAATKYHGAFARLSAERMAS